MAIANRLRSFYARNRSDIVIVVLWTALISFMVIQIFWFAYQESRRLAAYKIPLSYGGEGPTATFLDLFILLAASLAVGISISDAKEMVYGYLTAIFLAFTVSVVYVTWFIWNVLEWGEIFIEIAYEWEWAIFLAILNVFRVMVPWVVGICLVGIVVGAFLRTWIGWT